ncbi:hypothetical protein Pla111_07090 [Botrimarina hoheduenensis]|uniref:Uncharacterized protein n=1 Tax=Botrimarina hoheduenensis TaxID=2528000 RepID=A0A5C5WFP8_9BACT|nr:hypothetical protein Pla111_07090 [Botrimarina hoheduenensis]
MPRKHRLRRGNPSLGGSYEHPQKALRWIACLPAGVLSGLLASALTWSCLAPFCEGVVLLVFAAGTLSGLVQPVVGYHVGRASAPSKTRKSRDLMLYPYALLGYASAFFIFMHWWDGRPVEPVAASEWWADLGFYIGSALGCLSLLHPPTPRPLDQRDASKQPFASPFDWPKPASNS